VETFIICRKQILLCLVVELSVTRRRLIAKLIREISFNNASDSNVKSCIFATAENSRVSFVK